MPFHEGRSEGIKVIEGRWTLQILVCLNREERRFNELKRSLPGISAKILGERLNYLKDAGLVSCFEQPAPATHRVYTLANVANGLISALDALDAWSESFENRREFQ